MTLTSILRLLVWLYVWTALPALTKLTNLAALTALSQLTVDLAAADLAAVKLAAINLDDVGLIRPLALVSKISYHILEGNDADIYTLEYSKMRISLCVFGS
jgi:hypothetical protein